MYRETIWEVNMENISFYFHCRIIPNLRNVVYSTGVRNADESTWDKVFNKYVTEKVPSEKRTLMYVLAESLNERLLSR